MLYVSCSVSSVQILTFFLLFLLFDLTSQTDSVRSRSQSGYPNRKVHTLFLLQLTSCYNTSVIGRRLWCAVLVSMQDERFRQEVPVLRAVTALKHFVVLQQMSVDILTSAT